MKIIVTGGGTGGHVFPALEIAKALKIHHKTLKVIFVGNNNSLEEKMARASGIPFYGLATKKILGQGLLKKLVAVFALACSVVKSIAFLLRERPYATIGVGGYVSAPMLIASFVVGIRRYICEQNVVPGLANKYLSRLSDKVFISFVESEKFFPRNKAVHTGNPVREEFFLPRKKDASKYLRILITGGSLGAQFLNREIPKVFANFSDKNIIITHQTGIAMQQEVCAFYQTNNVKASVIPFIENMPKAFLDHDLLISRAGATVVAEIMASGMPAILVPYPYALGHQKENAMALVHVDGAIMVEQSANFKAHLAREIESLYSNIDQLVRIGENAKKLAKPKAAEIIASMVLEDSQMSKYHGN